MALIEKDKSNIHQLRFKYNNPDKECPSNLGKKWSSEEENLLLEELNENMDINIIAEKHKRTLGSVRSRQKEIAYKMFIQNTSITEIMNKTKLNEIQIREFIEKKHNRISISKSIQEAKIEARIELKKQHSMEDVIVELKEEIIEMRDEIKGLKKEHKRIS